MGIGQVVLVGHRYDEHADYLEQLLRQRGRVEVIRLALDDLPTASATWIPEGSLRLGDVELTAGAAGLLRRWGRPHLEEYQETFHGFMESECRDFLQGALEALSIHWLSTPSAVMHAELKLVQLSNAQAMGLPTPATVVTNDSDEAMAFERQHDGVIAKAVRYALVATDPEPRMAWTKTQTSSTLADLAGSPVILQEQVRGGIHLRVVTVDDDVFVSAVESSDVDWRQVLENHDRFQAVPVDGYPGLAKMASLLARQLGLGFSAQDWIVSPTRGPVFLEVNPSGQWMFLEPQHDGAIGRTIVDALERLALPNHQKTESPNGAIAGGVS